MVAEKSFHCPQSYNPKSYLTFIIFKNKMQTFPSSVSLTLLSIFACKFSTLTEWYTWTDLCCYQTDRLMEDHPLIHSSTPAVYFITVWMSSQSTTLADFHNRWNSLSFSDFTDSVYKPCDLNKQVMPCAPQHLSPSSIKSPFLWSL